MVECIPKQGDNVALTFDPQSGHEQKGRRPALIVSNETFNRHLGVAFVLPITSIKRNLPFCIALNSENLRGYIMCEQLKSIDYKSSKAKFIEKAKAEVLEDVLGIVESIMD